MEIDRFIWRERGENIEESIRTVHLPVTLISFDSQPTEALPTCLYGCIASSHRVNSCIPGPLAGLRCMQLFAYSRPAPGLADFGQATVTRSSLGKSSGSAAAVESVQFPAATSPIRQRDGQVELLPRPSFRFSSSPPDSALVDFPAPPPGFDEGTVQELPAHREVSTFSITGEESLAQLMASLINSRVRLRLKLRTLGNTPLIMEFHEIAILSDRPLSSVIPRNIDQPRITNGPAWFSVSDDPRGFARTRINLSV